MAEIVLLNKPFQVLCQFTDTEQRRTLASCLAPGSFAKVYPAGRLDYDSEGLVLLTDSGKLQHRISHPSAKLPKTYWVQVEGIPSDTALHHMSHSLILNDGPTQPTKVKRLAAPALWQRDPPVRARQHPPTSWLEVIMTEGRNRQVRRMTAAIGHPTLRLVRMAIGPWTLGELAPGEFRTERVHLPTPNMPKHSRARRQRK